MAPNNFFLYMELTLREDYYIKFCMYNYHSHFYDAIQHCALNGTILSLSDKFA